MENLISVILAENLSPTQTFLVVLIIAAMVYLRNRKMTIENKLDIATKYAELLEHAEQTFASDKVALKAEIIDLRQQYEKLQQDFHKLQAKHPHE